ncbi:site-specific integrase [Roseomonas sp. HF4]|uniref:site-specific integrase n=1 Tax=Roseomonas sp. HF4 TaxID=2562313 RepID=UPI0010BF765A|nr:site-specific integrase [Roseomonas sp. HF4]
METTGRLSLPLADWPTTDREAYAVACRRGDPFEEGGGAAGWRPATHTARIWAYGAWLSHLQRFGVDLDMEAAAERLTPERVREHVRTLRERCATYTVAGLLGHLLGFVLAVWPGRDWQWLSEAHRREQRFAEPVRNKAARIVPQEDLLRLGCDLMVQAEARSMPPPGSVGPTHPALEFRSGLLIALLAMRPLRRRNIVELAIGTTLRQTDEGWEIALPGAITKNHTPLVQSVPTVLVPPLEAYLTRYRPRLAEVHGRGPASTFPHPPGNALWLSRWGAPLTYGGARSLVEQHTRERFGHHVNCHLFRDCAATSLAEDNPEHVRIAADLLGHRSFATTARYYIAAGQRRALRRVQGTILAHRRGAGGTGRYAELPLESERS